MRGWLGLSHNAQIAVANIISPISAPTYTEQRARYTTTVHPYSDSRKELCGLYNSRAGNWCCYQPCRHLHVCAVCHEYGHPASTCKCSGTLAKRPRVDTKPTRNTQLTAFQAYQRPVMIATTSCHAIAKLHYTLATVNNIFYFYYLRPKRHDCPLAHTGAAHVPAHYSVVNYIVVCNMLSCYI